MNKLLLSFIILCEISFISCSKNQEAEESLSIYTNSIDKISYSTVLVSAKVKYGLVNQPSQIGVCYATTANPTTKDSVAICNVVQGAFSVSLQRLIPNTAYYIRAFATMPTGDIIYGEQRVCTTKDIEINYLKFYDMYTSNQDVIVTVEGATHTLYGKGFTNATMQFKMISRTNKNNILYPSVNIKNDSVLTFKIPDDAIGSVPYVRNQRFCLMVNNTRFKSLYAAVNKTETSNKDTTFFLIDNRDIHIDSVHVSRSTSSTQTCDWYDLNGRFANTWVVSGYDTYLGVPWTPVKRSIILKTNGSTTYIPVFNNSNTNFQCEEAWSMYRIVTEKPYNYFVYYQENGVIRYLHTFPSKAKVSFQVEQIMADGSVFRSNEYFITTP